MKTITTIPTNLINTVVDAEVTAVNFNRFSRTASITITVQIDDKTQLELTDVVFEESKYSLNDKKKDIYYDLFNSNKNWDLRKVVAHVDFNHNEYYIKAKLCVSKRGTNYFAIEDYERKEIPLTEEGYKQSVTEKTEALEELAVQAETVPSTLELKGEEATKAFLENKDSADWFDAISKIDEEYGPVHTFKAEEFSDLDEDMDVTYAMFAKVDDSLNMFVDQLRDRSYVIDDDSTLLEAIHDYLDNRAEELPDFEKEGQRLANEYYPEDFKRFQPVMTATEEAVYDALGVVLGVAERRATVAELKRLFYCMDHNSPNEFFIRCSDLIKNRPSKDMSASYRPFDDAINCLHENNKLLSSVDKFTTAAKARVLAESCHHKI